jgi:hypothetical protein
MVDCALTMGALMVVAATAPTAPNPALLINLRLFIVPASRFFF